MDTKIGNAKGSVFINVNEYILNTRGQDVWHRILTNLPDTDRETPYGNLV